MATRPPAPANPPPTPPPPPPPVAVLPTPPATVVVEGRPAWHALHLWHIQPLRDFLLLAAILGILYLGYQLSTVTVPLLLALLLAYLFEPLVQWLTRKLQASRGFVALMLIVCMTIVLVVPAGLGLTFGVLQGAHLAEEQIANLQMLVKSVDQPENSDLRDALPGDRWKKLRDWLVEQEAKANLSASFTAARRAALEGTATPTEPPANAHAGIEPPPPSSVLPQEGTASDPVNATGTVAGPTEMIEQSVSGAVAEATSRAVEALRANTAQIGKGAFQLGANLLSGFLGVLLWIGRLAFGAFLTAFFFYFFCTGWGSVRRFTEGFVPDDRKKRVFHLVKRMDAVVAGFVRGRLTICAVQIVFFTLGYWAIGCPAPLIVGPLVGMLTLVPYAAGLAMPIIMILMALNPDAPDSFRSAWWWIIGAPAVLQGISQVLDDYVLSPVIQGKNTDLSMPLILFASIAGGLLAGFYGLLVAIPVAACAKILWEEVVMPGIKAWAKGDAMDPLPIGRGDEPPKS